MDHGTVGDDADVGAFAHDARFAERDGEIRAGIFRAIVGLAIEMFVLEKHHGIVGPNRGAKKAANIEGGGRHHHAQAGDMRENNFAALAVINRAAGEVAANRHAHDDGSFEMSRRAPTHGGEFVAELHVSRPNVIEELNFRHGLQTAQSHADGAADDVSLGER